MACPGIAARANTYAMTLRYAHLAPEHKLKAVEVLDRRTSLAAVA